MPKERKYYTEFVPSDGEEFYHLCADGDILSKNFDNGDSYHQAMLHWRNCFRTKEKAKEARDGARELFNKMNITNLN